MKFEISKGLVKSCIFGVWRVSNLWKISSRNRLIQMTELPGKLSFWISYPEQDKSFQKLGETNTNKLMMVSYRCTT